MKREVIEKAILDFYKQDFDYITFYYFNKDNIKYETFLRKNISKILVNVDVLELKDEETGLVYFIDINKISKLLLGNEKNKSYILTSNDQPTINSLIRNPLLFDVWSDDSDIIASIACLEKQNNKKHIYYREIKRTDGVKNILKYPVVISCSFISCVLNNEITNDATNKNYLMSINVNFNKVNNILPYNRLFTNLQKEQLLSSNYINSLALDYSFSLWFPKQKILSPQFIIGKDSIISERTTIPLNIYFFADNSEKHKGFFRELAKIEKDSNEEIYLIINPNEKFIKKPSYKTLYGTKPIMVFYE